MDSVLRVSQRGRVSLKASSQAVLTAGMIITHNNNNSLILFQVVFRKRFTESSFRQSPVHFFSSCVLLNELIVKLSSGDPLRMCSIKGQDEPDCPQEHDGVKRSQ